MSLEVNRQFQRDDNEKVGVCIGSLMFLGTAVNET